MIKVVLLLLPVIFAITGSGCQEEKALAEIRLCADISANDPCVGEDSLFLFGTNVWVQLWLEPGFNDTVVTGNIYKYQNGQRIFEESITRKVKEGQMVVMEQLFFNKYGDFEVEFLDGKGNLLDKKEFEIW